MNILPEISFFIGFTAGYIICQHKYYSYIKLVVKGLKSVREDLKVLQSNMQKDKDGLFNMVDEIEKIYTNDQRRKDSD